MSWNVVPDPDLGRAPSGARGGSASGVGPARTPWGCWVAWAAILLAFLAVAWTDVSRLVATILSDDMFYYLTIGRHVALAGVASFDGVTPSNGFHPLWMLILAFLVAVAPGDLALPVHLALTVAAAAFVVQGIFLQRLLAGWGHPLLGGVVSFWWLLNPTVVRDMAAGMETAVYALCVLAVLFFYPPRRAALTGAEAGVLGGLLGLTTLARLDAGLLALVVTLDAAWGGVQRRAWVVPVAVGLPLGTLLGPWIVWSVATVGTPLPTSGRALDLWAFDVHAALRRMRWGPDVPEPMRPFLEWVEQHLRVLLGCPDLPVVPPLLLLALLAASVGLGTWVAVTVVRERRYAAFRAFLVVAVLHSGYYLLRAPHSRYLAPSLLIELVVAAVVLGDRLGPRVTARACVVRRWGCLLLAVALVGWSILFLRQWQRGTLGPGTRTLHAVMYTQGVPWLQAHTPPSAVIGSFNAGIFGYFSGRRVVNLDGVVNEHAYEALAARRLADYVRETEIEWLIDWAGQLEWFLARFSTRSRFPLEVAPVAAFELPPSGKERLVVYRVLQPSGPWPGGAARPMRSGSHAGPG